MTLEPIITGLRRATGRIEKMQLTRLAFFDADIGPFRIRGATLLKTDRSGEFTAWMPRMLSDKNPAGDERRSLTIIDPVLLKQIAEAAHRTYIALGGTD